MLSATLGIQKLRIRCILGVLPHEQLHPQDIYLDVEMRGPCIPSDHLDDTIDYFTVAETCTQVATAKAHHLIETLATELLTKLFEKYHKIDWAKVKIHKPMALATAEAATIEISATRQELVT